MLKEDNGMGKKKQGDVRRRDFQSRNLYETGNEEQHHSVRNSTAH